MSNSNSNSNSNDELFSSLISDIKTYTGNDPLLPWLRGIRKMRDSLPPLLLKEKLPRFLQKCAQTFQTDRRYTNDLRYFRVWLQLMDFVDDPRAVLSTMEANRIGMKKSLFYQAHALYYEKLKNFEEADKMYHLGVQNLAEPIDELQKSYEEFLHRMERHKKKKMQCQERTRGKGLLRVVSLPPKCNEAKRNNEKSLPEAQPNHENVEVSSDSSLKMGVEGDIRRGSFLNRHDNNQAESDEPNNFCGDDTVVVRFLGTAIAGQSEAEDACHHGLVEPTINTKEALNAINSMFREPLEPAHFNRRSHKSNKPKADQRLDKGFEVFVDENLDEAGSSNQNGEKGFEPLQHNRVETNQILQEPLQIYIDDEESNEVEERINVKDDLEESKVQQLTEHVNAFVFPSPNDLDTERSPRARLREDTVVCRFVGSTISDEPQVENVCHHGLVEPTINLKEAMDDINSMFGKPIEFVRANRRKKQDKAPYNSKNNCEGFLILPDDDLGHQRVHSRPSPTPKNDGLFEQTVCTKEALDEINKMFGMPLDF